MKVIRRSDKEFFEDAQRRHGEVLAHHRDVVKRIKAENDEERKRHKQRVAEADARFEQARENHARLLAQIEEDKEKLKRGSKEVKEGLLDKALGVLGFGSERREEVEFEFEPPMEPVKEKIPDPVMLAEPPEPEFEHEIPTFTVRDVQIPKGDDADPFEMVETPWGPARAHAGSYVLANDETGALHIETAEAFERSYEKA